MARYKEYSYDQGKLIPLNLREQLVPGTFEFALNYIVDEKLELGVFERRYRNDETGAPAFDPAILLKIILYAYSRGITSSREIARCCEENVMFMALSADTQPHWTTIADFVSSMRAQIEPLFLDVLAICWSEGLIGRELFAVDGCKISSNCSKEWSGTVAELAKKRDRLRRSVRFLLGKHRHTDRREPKEDQQRKRERRAVGRLKEKIERIEEFLGTHKDKPGRSGGVKQSNVTDNESAKMTSSHGVVQGYNGQAMVDSERQVVVHAEAFGEGHEGSLLKPMVDGARKNVRALGAAGALEGTAVTADAGYHTEENMRMLVEEKIDAYVADRGFRQRDPRFADTERYKKRTTDSKHTARGKKYFTPSDFQLDKETNTLICPAGKRLYVKVKDYTTNNDLKGTAYWGRKRDCRVCALRKKCLRSPRSELRQVAILKPREGTFTQRMIEKFDSARGRYIYGRRMGTVEPVFANITSTLGLNRFSLRGKAKVDTQWKLFCMVHNLLKIWRYGPAFA